MDKIGGLSEKNKGDRAMNSLFHKVAEDESIKKEDLDPIVKSILSSLNQPDLFKNAGGQIVSASAGSSGSGSGSGDSVGDEDGAADDVMLDDVLNDILDEDDADGDSGTPASTMTATVTGGIQQQLENMAMGGNPRPRLLGNERQRSSSTIKRKKTTLGLGSGAGGGSI